MNKINLEELNLKTFTEQDALDYCSINNVNPDNIILLSLFNNYLTDISGIKVFKNLERLNLFNNELKDISVIKNLDRLKVLNIAYNNKIADISVIQYLNNLEYLDIEDLELKSDQIQYIKNLQTLYCPKGFKDMSVLNQLKNVKIHKI